MEITAHNEITAQLLAMVTPENQATASELLTSLTEDYSEVTNNLAVQTKSVAELTANNETLRDVNAKLFLKVGSSEPPKVKPITDPDNQESVITPKSFDDLFTENGELK